MAIGHNIRGSSIDQVGRSWDNVGEAVKTVGERIASSGEVIGLCAIRQAEENAARFFTTIRALQETPNSLDVAKLFTWAVAEGAEARREQLVEMGQVITKNIYPWEPHVDLPAPRQKA